MLRVKNPHFLFTGSTSTRRTLKKASSRLKRKRRQSLYEELGPFGWKSMPIPEQILSENVAIS